MVIDNIPAECNYLSLLFLNIHVLAIDIYFVLIIVVLGEAILHAYICIIFQYLVIFFARGNLFSTVFLFLFQMGYLLGEYFLTETAMYDIKWTIPHCVLTIRLIGQAFDIYDGTKDPVSFLALLILRKCEWEVGICMQCVLTQYFL